MRGRNTINAHGFTLIELLIATAIFSIVLTIAVTGFVQVGKVFYKGVINTNNQQALRDVVDQISSDIHNAPSVGTVQSAGMSTADSDGKTYQRYYQCIGSDRYTWILGKRVDLSHWDKNVNFGLMLDVMPGTACSDPYTSSFPLNNPTELLGTNMRLNHLFVTPQVNCGSDNLVACSVYDVNVGIATGSDQIFAQIPRTGEYKCSTNLSLSQFCAVSELRTSVQGVPLN